MRHQLAFVGAVCGALLAVAPLGARTGVLPAGNLVQNPGAEASPGATTINQTATPTGWVTTGGFTAVAYDDRLGFPGPTISAGIRGGANFFAGGQNTQVGTATQTIDIASAATEVDAGQVTATLSAFLGGYGTHPDTAHVDLEFLSATGATLGNVRVGPVTNGDRGNVTKLLARTASATVPPSTRQLKVTITATRSIGPYNDGYADNVSVQLGGKATTPPATGKPTLILKCTGHRVTSTVKPAVGQSISAVAFVVGGAVVTTDAKAPFAATFSARGRPASIKVTALSRIGAKTVKVTGSVKRC